MKKSVLWMLAVILCCGPMLSSCSHDDDDKVETRDFFPSWNQCEALSALQEYVQDVRN